jgi:Na+/H+ antiporter NhaD/arsenite permease-like protein
VLVSTFCRFSRRPEPGVDSNGRCGPGDGACAARHARRAEADRLAFAPFFAALFIVVDGLSDTGLPDAIYSRLQPIFGSNAPMQAWNLTWCSVVGSNVFLNVPFVSVAGNWIAQFPEPTLMWKILALATTFAGNLTIVGSVANMIVMESARDHIQVGFWDYARFGIPITILTTAAGVIVLLVLH